MKGTEVDVTIIEVDPDFKKIVLSMDRADQYTQLKAIHLGALMWGEVRRIEEFGAFIGLEGTRISGLLHISNISRARVESVQVLPIPSSPHSLYSVTLQAEATACLPCAAGDYTVILPT